MMTLPRFDRHPADLPLSLETTPPEDLNELPTWPEIIDACDPLSLDEPFEVYKLAQQWGTYPAGTLCVISRHATYLQPVPSTGFRISPTNSEEPYFTASGVGCRQCPLAESRGLIVEGMGPYNPKVMIVAEAPGGDEDVSGMPFVGQSGMLLRSYLSEVGFRADDYFMTNTVRCRPPGNRTPTRSEIAACSHWLEEETKRVNPRSVLLLGATARASFKEAWLPPGTVIGALAHPASLLHHPGPGKTAAWVQSLRGFAAAIGVAEPAAHLQTVALEWEHGDPDPDADVLAVDTETRSLEDDYKSGLVCLQLSDGRCAELYFPVHRVGRGEKPLWVRYSALQERVPGSASPSLRAEMEQDADLRPAHHAPVPQSPLRKLAAPKSGDGCREPSDEPGTEREDDTEGRPDQSAGSTQQAKRRTRAGIEAGTAGAEASGDRRYNWPELLAGVPSSEWQDLDFTARRYIYHNVKYDLPRIGGDLRRLETWEDTALIAYILRYPRVGLKAIGPDLTGIPMAPITSILGSGKKQISFDEALARTPEQAVDYALKDAVVTARMFPVLYAELAKHRTLLRYYKDIEKPVVPVVFDMEQNGALIDNQALDGLADELAKQMEIQRAVAQMWADDEINPNSGREIAKAVQSLGGVLKDKTKTGEIQTDKTALLRCCGVESADDLRATGDPLVNLVRAILGYKQFGKLLSTYVPALRRRDGNARIHTNFNQMVTDTSRFSSSDPNLQNIPSRSAIGKRFRKCFIAPPGKVIVKADFSQLELRIYAHYTGEQILRDAYTGAERDVHALFAQQWGVDRSIAKNGVFGLVYGVEARKLAATLGIPESRTREFIDEMRRTMPSIAGGWQEHISHILDQYGYVETLYGWRNYYPEHRSPIKSSRKAALREASNLPIQGTAGGILKQLLVAYDQWRQATGAWDSVPILMVHDEIVFEVPSQYAGQFGREIAQLAPAINPLNVNLVLSVEIGPDWGSTVPLEKWNASY